MKTTVLTLVLALTFGLALAPATQAATSKNLEVTKPLADGKVSLTFSANGVTDKVEIPIKGTDTAAEKRQKIKDKLAANGYTATNAANNSLNITNLPNGTTVTWDPSTTGEDKDQLTDELADVEPETPADAASMAFADSYDAIGGDGNPSTFTAGVVTSGGAAEITITAEGPVAVEVPVAKRVQADADGSSVSGQQVAEDLFFALSSAVEAAGLDVVLFLDGTTIHVQYGDGAGSSRGIVFGTSATNAGVVGTID
jgi:hypothetical protein